MLNDIDADITVSRHIRMNNFREKPNDWRTHWVAVGWMEKSLSGGFFGKRKKMITYDDGIMMCRKNLPPSYELPTGPRIDACQWDSWLSNGTASMPSAASESSVRISPRRRFERIGLSACRGNFNVIWMRHVWQKHEDSNDLYIWN